MGHHAQHAPGDHIVLTHQTAGTQLTVTTEFGPATYMPVKPYTQLPSGK